MSLSIPPGLAGFRISGLGGSDMSPGMLRLAKDTQVENVLVLTDGYIDFPRERPPYEVLWVIINGMSDFSTVRQSAASGHPRLGVSYSFPHFPFRVPTSWL